MQVMQLFHVIQLITRRHCLVISVELTSRFLILLLRRTKEEVYRHLSVDIADDDIEATNTTGQI